MPPVRAAPHDDARAAPRPANHRRTRASRPASTPSNWNAVVLGGAIVAALALAGEPGAPPWLGDELLPAALAGIQPSLADLGPGSGANREGPNYHGYLVRAGLAPAAASALSATGGASDGGLLPPGARAAPAYALYTMAPTHPVAQFHYYADTHATPEAVTQYLFLARHFNDSAMAAGFRALGLATADDPRSAAVTAMNAPFAVLFFTAAGGPADVAALPRARAFPEVHAVTSRSSWADANATFIAWKGSNVSWAWAHAHLDGGSFVFATQGQWFAQELGSDSYSSPDYFGKGRFKLCVGGRRGTRVGGGTAELGRRRVGCCVRRENGEWGAPPRTWLTDASRSVMP